MVELGERRPLGRAAVSVVVPDPSGIVLVTVCDAVSITDTVSSLALVTYAVEPSALNAVFHGVRPTRIRPTVRRIEMLEHDDLVPLGVGHLRVAAVGRDRHAMRLVQRARHLPRRGRSTW